MEDYFDNIDQLPKDAKAIAVAFIDEYDNTSSNHYKLLENYLGMFEEVGYTFEYGLDAEPYNLRPIVKGDTVRIKHGHELSDAHENDTFTYQNTVVVDNVKSGAITMGAVSHIIPLKYIRVMHD
jgi:hypothetical protein